MSLPARAICGLLVAVSLFPGDIVGQETEADPGIRFLDKIQFDPIVDFQLWGTYTHGTQIADTIPGEFIPVDDRVNFVLRRARFGFTAKPNERWTIGTIAQIDLVGRDILAGYHGGANNTTFPEVGLWDLRIMYKVSKRSQAAYLTGGYFGPAFSREHLTPWHLVSSFAKSNSQLYIRRHLTGKGPGRSLGLNMGGFLLVSDKFRLRYDAGVFNPVYIVSLVNTSGKSSTLLVSSRLNLQFGQPETPKYSYMLTTLDGNLVRKSVSIGLSGHWQGTTEIFSSSYGFAFDFLVNRGPWHMEGDISLLTRSGERQLESGVQRDFNYSYVVGYVRTGYFFKLKNNQFLEPSVLYNRFEGATALVEQEDATAVLSPSGTTWVFDVGVNWHVIKGRLKLSAHYTFQGADAGEAGAQDIRNELIIASGTVVQRGDWAGIGAVIRL